MNSNKFFINIGRKCGKTTMIAKMMLAKYISQTYDVSIYVAWNIITDVMRHEDDIAAEEACQK